MGWEMRQAESSPVILSAIVAKNASKLAHVVLDVDDEWQVFSTRKNEKLLSACLADAVSVVPEMTQLKFLPPGIVARWESKRRVWQLESLDLEDWKEAETWRHLDWNYPVPPDLECVVSRNLIEVGASPLATPCQLSFLADGEIQCWGAGADENDEMFLLLAHDLLRLHPEVGAAYDSFSRRPIDLCWNPARRTWDKE